MVIAQSEKEQNGQAGRAWLRNELEGYSNRRQTIIELFATPVQQSTKTSFNIGKVLAYMHSTLWSLLVIGSNGVQAMANWEKGTGVICVRTAAVIRTDRS